MRILIAHSFLHARGGDSTYARTLAKGLEDAGHEVAWLATRHPANDPSPWEPYFPPQRDFSALTPRTALSAAVRSAWDPRAQAACAALIDAFRPDVLHLQHVHHHLTPSIIVPARRAGIPVVWTVHDYELICPNGLLFTEGAPCERCRSHRYREAVAHRCKRDSAVFSAFAAIEKTIHRARGLWGLIDRFLCPSQFLADKLIAFGVPARRVVVEPNACDPNPVSGDPGAGWLFAGRLTVEKGVRVALDAARLVDARVAICGDGPLAAEVRTAAADLPHLRALGQLSPDDLRARVQAAAVVAVPSLWWENLPYAVIEAQSAGKAVIASRVGGIPELIDDGVDGILVPPGDSVALAGAIAALLADPDRARELGQAGARRVRDRMSVDDHVARVLAHYAVAGLARRGYGA